MATAVSGSKAPSMEEGDEPIMRTAIEMVTSHRGENSQKEGKEPHIGSSEQLQPITLSHARVYDDGENAEEQNIEGEFDGRHTQSRPVDDNDVEGVR